MCISVVVIGAVAACAAWIWLNFVAEAQLKSAAAKETQERSRCTALPREKPFFHAAPIGAFTAASTATCRSDRIDAAAISDENANTSSAASSSAAMITEEIYKSTWCKVSPSFSVCTLSNDWYFSKKRPKKLQFAVLKNQNLFFYTDEAQSSTLAALCIADCAFDVNSSGVLRADELFRKEFPLQISSPFGTLFGPSSRLFMHFTSGAEKEDWFYALNRAKVAGGGSTQDATHIARFDAHARQFFARVKRTVEGVLPAAASGTLRIVNLLAGRLFYNVADAGAIEALIVEKVRRSLEISPLPAFLGGVSVKQTVVGNVLPVLTAWDVHRFHDNGECKFFADIEWGAGSTPDEGEDAAAKDSLKKESEQRDVLFRITLQLSVRTDAVPLLSRITGAFAVPIVVAAVVRRLAGRLYFVLPPPPSDRVWTSFVEPPALHVDVAPVVAATAIRMPAVLNFVRRRIVEAVNETLVYPAMEDLFAVPLASRAHGRAIAVLRQSVTPPAAASTGDSLLPASQLQDAAAAKTAAETALPADPLHTSIGPFGRSVHAVATTSDCAELAATNGEDSLGFSRSVTEKARSFCDFVPPHPPPLSSSSVSSTLVDSANNTAALQNSNDDFDDGASTTTLTSVEACDVTMVRKRAVISNKQAAAA